MNNFIQNEDGFTLVEILLTISLIGILSISILQLFSIGNRWQQKHLNTATAMLIAQGTLEQMKSDKKSKGFGYLNESRYNQDTFAATGVEQSVRIDCLSVDLKKIVITMQWSGGSDSLVSMIGKY